MSSSTAKHAATAIAYCSAVAAAVPYHILIVDCGVGSSFTVSNLGDKELAVSDQGQHANVKGMKDGRKEQEKCEEW